VSRGNYSIEPIDRNLRCTNINNSAACVVVTAPHGHCHSWLSGGRPWNGVRRKHCDLSLWNFCGDNQSFLNARELGTTSDGEILDYELRQEVIREHLPAACELFRCLNNNALSLDSAPAAVWHHERGTNRRLEEVREEFSKLMLEQVESLRAQTFGVLSEEEGRLTNY
jgi:hypothetical protein